MPRIRRPWSVVALVLLVVVAGGSVTIAAAPPDVVGCPTATGPIEAVDDAQLFGVMAGRWVRCGGPGLPSMPPEQAGLELTSDGRWYALYLGGGELLRGDGLGQAGRYRLTPLVDEPDGFGLSFFADGGTFVPGVPVGVIRYADPPLTLLRPGGTTAPFTGLVPWTGAPPIAGSPVPTFLGCPPSAGARVARSPDEERGNVTGIWISCSGTSPFDRPAAGEVGLELTTDGSWYRLLVGGDGRPVRASSPTYRGTYRNPDPAIPGWIELPTADGGTGTPLESVSVAVFSDPQQLYVSGLRSAAGYVPWDGRPIATVPPAGGPTLPATGLSPWVLCGLAALLVLVGLALRRTATGGGSPRRGGRHAIDS